MSTPHKYIFQYVIITSKSIKELNLLFRKFLLAYCRCRDSAANTNEEKSSNFLNPNVLVAVSRKYHFVPKKSSVSKLRVGK